VNAPVEIKLRRKYRSAVNGKYKSSHNDGQRGPGRKKATPAQKVWITARQPKMVRVMGPTGKLRMVRTAS
jgi:hypothetical protein